MKSSKYIFESRFQEALGKAPLRGVALSEYSHFQIGGKADYFIESLTPGDLQKAIQIASVSGVPFFILGGGYNILFDDDGFRGLIIRNAVKGIQRKEKNRIEVWSGTPIKDVVRFVIDESLENLEFLTGIPGTVGGAVYGNAGAFNYEIGDFLEKAALIENDGNTIDVSREYFDFGYRNSVLKSNSAVILRSIFKVSEGEKNRIESRIQDFLEKRKTRHPPESVRCAGSYFKNPVLPSGEKSPAATFLDKVGAKNIRIGGAAVYSGHANFIINEGDATSKDVLKLAAELKRRVRDEFGISLKEEIIYLPANP